MSASASAVWVVNLLYIAAALVLAGCLVWGAVSAARGRRRTERFLEALRQELRQDSQGAFSELRGEIGRRLAEEGERTERKLDALREATERSIAALREESGERSDRLRDAMERSLGALREESGERADRLRDAVEKKLTAFREENGKQLDRMRETVDEKLQKTLEERIGQSFKRVNEQLEQVYGGVGEMRRLASDVGDLKKVLSNVKTRGILGEIQLGAILEQILAREQYEENVVTRPGASERVEFAIRLPGDGNGPVYLPIDAKFPADAYAALTDAYEAGDAALAEKARKNLEQAAKTAARTIRDKYIEPPGTTDFAIMFLPVEGLYAELVRMGMVETLQREYKVSLAGPTTMAAMLNSLQMGFRTLAIQKRSSDVWKVLGAVKTEFEKFAGVLESARRRLGQADADLERLIGTRTNVIRSKLKNVTELPDEERAGVLEAGGAAFEADGEGDPAATPGDSGEDEGAR